QLILTKGDKDAVDDASLYPGRRSFVGRENAVVLVRGSIPYMGQLTVVVKDWLWIPYTRL
ncbi:uncharacterized protein BDR25DRAFT_159273, partial [Lindgomyces ingoldianus]